MRLQRYIAASGVCSRRRAEELIAEGRVQLNGTTVTTPGTVIAPESDRVAVDGKTLTIEKPALYLFCKPAKVVATLADPEGRPCLADFVDSLAARVFPVGRLDYDVTGLLLLTNSGEFAEQLQHPRYGVERTYWALVQGKLNAKSRNRAINGVTLDDGAAQALRCEQLVPNRQTTLRLGPPRADCSLVEIVVAEGRNHYVKRLMEALEHPVVKLCRVGFGPYKLGSLQPGEIRRARFRP